MKLLENDISQLYRDLKNVYPRLNVDQKTLFNNTLIKLAKELGIRIPKKDDRDMYLLSDENGKFLKSFRSFRDAQRESEKIPDSKWYNRTHPGCPKELLKQFNQATGIIQDDE